jgi:MFS transporter, AAHS family, 4-hydroxybenzoate transporter
MSGVPAAAAGGPWTAYQKCLVCLTAITIVFDGMDNQLLGITIPSLIADWHVPRSTFAPVVSLGFAGMMVGGWRGVRDADRARVHAAAHRAAMRQAAL